MNNKKPIIGLSSSYEKDEKYDRIYLNHSYLDTIRHFDAIPLILPVEGTREELETLIDMCDGVLLTGGDDIDPKLYGEEILNDTVSLTPDRDKGEAVICDLAVERDLPMFGICRGIQMMNVYFGGSLYQDIPAQIETEVKHSMVAPFHRCCHDVVVEKDSPLHKLVGRDVIGVNSHHHQAVKAVAPGFIAMGHCPDDGVIEAICNPDKKFVWGVQWHPERVWDIEDASTKVFEAFVEACKK